MANSNGISNAVEQMTSLHYINSPGYAYSRLEQLKGEVDTLRTNANSDPLLFAYQIQDSIKRIARMVLDMEKWSTAVVDATPDQIVNEGANRCH